MMFPDQTSSYASSHASGPSSDIFSFDSPSSGSSAYTPPSTRRESFDSSYLEDSSLIDYVNGSSFSMPLVSSEELSAMPDLLFSFDYKMEIDPEIFSMEPFMSSLPFASSHGMQLLPSSMTPLAPNLQSPMLDLSSSENDFVDPCQTFIEAYNGQSPACISNFDSSPMPEYARSSYSPSCSMLYLPFSDDMTSPSTTVPSSKPTQPRQAMCAQPLETTTALQRAQSDAHEKRSATTPNNNKHNRETTGNGSDSNNSSIRYQGRAKKECTWAGCGGKFQRQEHLKRHERTHFSSETFRCQFCLKPFGRSDNLKSHVRLHTNPGKKSSRTDFFPDAVRVYAEMSRRPRRAVSENGLGLGGGLGCDSGSKQSRREVVKGNRSRGAGTR